MTEEKSKQGKKNRRSGATFELKVRKDLEEKGWIVSKWQNNVEMQKVYENKESTVWHFGCNTKLIPAKRKYNPFNKALSIGTGFPDFIIYTFKQIKIDISKQPYEVERMDNGNLRITRNDCEEIIEGNTAVVFGVEVKSNGYLDKEEKEKCKWLLENNVFSKILIAKKGKRGEIIYNEFVY